MFACVYVSVLVSVYMVWLTADVFMLCYFLRFIYVFYLVHVHFNFVFVWEYACACACTRYRFTYVCAWVYACPRLFVMCVTEKLYAKFCLNAIAYACVCLYIYIYMHVYYSNYNINILLNIIVAIKHYLLKFALCVNN